jgi:formylglycine-generating enzyme required for sulfatase activity
MGLIVDKNKPGIIKWPKMLLIESLLLRLMLSHIFASYVALLIFWCSKFFISGVWNFRLVPFFLAPLYVPLNMISGPMLVIARFPYFDLMPPMREIGLLWVSYLFWMVCFVCFTHIWSIRTRVKMSVDEMYKISRFNKYMKLSLILILFVAATAFCISRSSYIAYAPDIKLANIPAGEFIMGAPPTDEARLVVGDQEPQHSVRISKGFYMGITEVTQSQWKAVMRSNPSEFRGDDLPVDNVSWDDTVKFCEKLSRLTGKFYRLPTEAEWEYACRAGTQTRFYFGDDPNILGQYAWWLGNSEGKTHPVGQKKANAFGLYDMHGNVEEWCSDLYDDEYYERSPRVDPESTDRGIFRVLRGGSCCYLEGSIGLSCRSAAREATYPYMRTNTDGFRVVMEEE